MSGPDNNIMARDQEDMPSSPQAEMMVSRQAQEVQAAMIAAKRFPRDEYRAIERIKATCQRPTLASQAVYRYPKGGQSVSGPSIRLAEALAQNWGNMDTGIIELENNHGASTMMAYAWDLETNTRVTKIFTVEHKRDTKQGSKALTDGRDIYEATANFGARRMRACILSIIPGDVVDMAVEECKATVASADKRPVEEILKELLKAFKDIKVSKEQLEKYFDKQLTVMTKEDLVDLRAVYKAIKDGQSKAEDYFGVDQTSAREAAKAKIDAAQSKAQEAAELDK